MTDRKDCKKERCGRCRKCCCKGEWKSCCPVTVSDLTNIVPPPQETSGPIVPESPFYDQTFVNLGEQGSLYRNNEAEPSLAINPRDKDNLVAFFQQDRWTNGAAVADRVRFSKDGGKTWRDPTVPFPTSRFQDPAFGRQFAPPFGLYDRASDPWIRFGKDGVVHALFETVFTVAEGYNTSITDVYHSKSVDGGDTWSPPVLVAASDETTLSLDKMTMTVDPVFPHILYVAVTNYIDEYGDFTLPSQGIFVRSIDGGATWEPLKAVVEFTVPPDGNTPEPIGAQVAALNDGTLLFVYGVDSFFGMYEGATNMEFVRSFDRGVTWDPMRYKIGDIVRPTDPLPSEVFPNNPGDYELDIPIRAQYVIPGLTVNQKNNYVYVTWQDSRYNTLGRCGSVITFSANKGDSWSYPMPVNPTSLDVQSFLPTPASFGDRGHVAVLFYDFRFDVSGDNQLTTDVWVNIFNKDLSKMIQQIRLTPQSFDMRQAIRVSGGSFFPGDYMDLQPQGKCGLGAIYVCTNQLGLFPPTTLAPATVEPLNHQDPVFTAIVPCAKNNHCLPVFDMHSIPRPSLTSRTLLAKSSLKRRQRREKL